MTTFDLESLRRFATDVGDKAAECSGNDEFCSDLDRHIQCLAAECAAWLGAVKDWAAAIYHREVEFDTEAESLFRQELIRVANKARPHAQHGREVVRECYSLERLRDLEQSLAELDFLSANWVRPKPSILVVGRSEVPDGLGGTVETRARELPPLPADWLPEDLGQRRRLQRKR